jgi:hypothetical protein
MDKGRKPWLRGAVSLAVLAGLAAALIASPATAHFLHPSKAQVKKVARQMATQRVNALAPGIAQAAVSADNASAEGVFRAFNQAGGTVPTGLASIGDLNVPAGSYAIFAKVNIFDSSDIRTQCFLTAGGSTDVGGEVSEQHSGSLDGQGAIALALAHTFTGSGTIDVACDDFGDADDWEFLQILAVRQPSATSSAARTPRIASPED